MLVEPDMSHFTTRAAQEEFMKKFTDPVQDMLSTPGAVPDSTAAYVKMGQCWGDAERAITGLTGDEAHVPREGETLTGRDWARAVPTQSRHEGGVSGQYTEGSQTRPTRPDQPDQT